MLDEFNLIDRIRRHAPTGSDVLTGIGDDCAVLTPPPGEQLLVTSDLLLEGVHFRRDWTSPEDLGAKSVAVNLSDLAAMGAMPRYLLLGLGIPADFPEEDLDLLIRGFCRAATAYGVSLVGGDTCRAQQFLTVAVTAFGTAPAARIVRRSGAAAGESILVSGTLGESALALKLLQEHQVPAPQLAERHHRPVPRVELGQRLAAVGVSAMIDISDGLLADLGHILRASSVGAELETAALPLSAPFRQALDHDPSLLHLALSGGEDYELLLTAPDDKVARLQAAARTCKVPLTVIGRTLADPAEFWLVDAGGGRFMPELRGYQHALSRL